MNNIEKFGGTRLPNKEDFYSTSNDKRITDNDY